MEYIQGMQVYVELEKDWVNFVNGNQIVSYKNQLQDYYKKINISGIEIISMNNESVTIVKRY